MNLQCFKYQYFFNPLCLGLFLGISVIFACQSSPDPNDLTPKKADINTESGIQPVARQATLEEMFEQLKRKNPGNILDNDFRPLRRLVNSKTYLDFLRRNHPIEVRYQTYDAFWQIAAADLSRYDPLLKAHIKKPIAEDVADTHLLAAHYRHVLTRGYHGEDHDLFEDQRNQVLEEVGWNVAFRHFVHDEANQFLNGGRLANFLVDVLRHAEETEQRDAAFAQELFDKHGADDALIWIALKDPVLIGYILKDFTDTQVFLKWMAGEFHQ